MRLKTDGTTRYFNRAVAKWDALYSDENTIEYFFNKLFRKGLFDRYRLTFEHCGELHGASVLDIGCGTGRYSIECARKGAARVLGIDSSDSMVDFCRTVAQRSAVSDRCQFITADFSEIPFNEHFDLVIAMGFFDYVEDAFPAFVKIAHLTRGLFLASFPAPGILWRFQRKVRYKWIKKCPVYNYNYEQLRELCERSGFSSYQIVQLKQGFFLIANERT